MTNKEALLFVGKCLTLGIHPERSDEIKEQIMSGKVIWEKIVWVSSGHLVLPAFYLQLKRAKLLGELPQDLVEYMEYLTECNRQRNKEIIDQMNDIARLLNSHSIKPVFLKGTAHLLIDLYEDIAERMIGDIDFLVEEDQCARASELLIAAGYKPLRILSPDMVRIIKHYPRLRNFNYPAAVEVHRQVLIYPYDKHFNASIILESKMKVMNGFEVFVPSTDHLIIHNILNTQLNDKAFLYGEIKLRSFYDLLLLSEQKKPFEILAQYSYRPTMTNTYLAIANIVLGHPENISYKKSFFVWFHLNRYNFFLKYPGNLHSAYKSTLYLILRFSNYFVLPVRSVFDKKIRASLIARLTNPKWYKRHFLSYFLHFKSETTKED